jgi:hypothetical protein
MTSPGSTHGYLISENGTLSEVHHRIHSRKLWCGVQLARYIYDEMKDLNRENSTYSASGPRCIPVSYSNRTIHSHSFFPNDINMRFSVLTTAAFAGSVLAAPSVQAPAQSISNVQFVLDGYAVILSNAGQLVEKVTALKAGDDIVAKLKEMSTLSKNTIDVTEKLTVQINAIPGKLTATAAGKLALPSTQVAKTTVQIVDTLVTKKGLFVTAKVHPIVLEDLNHLYSVSVAFVAAAKSKVPAQYVSVASPQFQQLLDSLQKGIQNFSLV